MESTSCSTVSVLCLEVSLCTCVKYIHACKGLSFCCHYEVTCIQSHTEVHLFVYIYMLPPLMYPGFVLELSGIVVVPLQIFPISTILGHM